MRNATSADCSDRRSGGHEKGDPGLLRKAGAYGAGGGGGGVCGGGGGGRPPPPNGEGGGRAPPPPPLVCSTGRRRCSSCHHLFEPCGPAPQGCRKAFLAARRAFLSKGARMRDQEGYIQC